MNAPQPTTFLPNYDPKELEPRWVQAWRKGDYFRADPKSDRPPYCIVLPPPNVTGSLHLGHALTATIQDILIRWRRMSGWEVLWVPGTDHAGIATQMVVERDLLATEGRTRHDLGRAAFLEKVWAWKGAYGARIGEQFQALGASLDWSRERFSLDAGLSTAVREVFVRLYEEGLIYRAQRLIHWDPVLLTALSDLEVENEERDGFLWSIAYPIVGSEERLVVATTRPETMLGDVALAVHPEDPRYRHLLGKKALLPLLGRELRIIGDDILVDPKFGTGVVKVTPAHDHADYATGQRHGLPFITVLDERGVVNEHGGRYQGLDRFEARKRILEDLRAEGLLVEEKPYKVPLAISQRSSVPVEPRLSWQWYVRTKPLADAAVASVERGEVKFVPEGWTNTFYSWMRNIHDWCISRQLWWGHQIPAWYPADEDGKPDFTSLEVHVDHVPPPKGKWVQDPDVLDTWFSSALWPFSTLGWPAETPEFKRFYPNAVLETGHDIIFFWVARMMMMGIHFCKLPPFGTVYLHAMVRDEHGEKMSKTKGNVIDPLDVIHGASPESLSPVLRKKYPQGMPAYGADALRMTFASLTQQGRELRMSLERVAGYKAFCNKLWNAVRFALINAEGYDAQQPLLHAELSLADRWILSRLNQTIAETTKALEAFDFSSAASRLYQFTWGELCDWYIELAKLNFAGEGREATQAVLMTALEQTLRLLHPFIPFITEELWHALPIHRPTESVALAPYPKPVAEWSDAGAEEAIAPILGVVSAIRSIRGESNIHPGKRILVTVFASDTAQRSALEQGAASIRTLAGVSELSVVAKGARPALAAVELWQGVEVYVPLEGVIDLDEERRRITKELDRIEGELKGLAGKLANKQFRERAPKEIVAKDEARVEALKERKAKLTASRDRLSAAPAKSGKQAASVQPARIVLPVEPIVEELDEVVRTRPAAPRRKKPARSPAKEAKARPTKPASKSSAKIAQSAALPYAKEAQDFVKQLLALAEQLQSFGKKPTAKKQSAKRTPRKTPRKNRGQR